MGEPVREVAPARDLEEANEFGLTQLHEACVAGNTELVQSLLDRGANIHALAGDMRSTPLHLGAEYRQEEVVALLLRAGAAPDLLTGDHEGDTPLHIAAGNLNIFEQMVARLKAQSSLQYIRNNKMQTLLHYAAGKGNLEVVDFLIAKGVAKSPRDYTGATPFHFAARNGKSVTSVLERLMDHVDEANDVGLTALHYASWNGHNDVVKWLLQKGASVAKVDRSDGDTALHWAAQNGSVEVISTLLDNKADVSATNKNGELPVDLAILLNHKAAIRTISNAMITSRVFNLMAHHDDGTLLHYAASCATEKDVAWVLSEILQNTARDRDGKQKNFEKNVNRRDKKGQNAFHWAASDGNTSVIKILQKKYVDPLAKDADNRTPLCIALIHKQLQFAGELLRCLGEHLTSEEWMNTIQLWTDTFNRDIPLELLQSFRNHMVGSYSDEDIIKEMPAIYKAICVGKQDIAKFIQRKRRIFEFVNGKGEITGRTALHWATILKQKKLVTMLCSTEEFSKDLLANIADNEDKRPLDYDSELEIVKELRKRPEVQIYVDGLYRDRQVYVDVSNAILVGAAFIASVTYEGWIQGSLNNEFQYFWIANSSSFFFSIATMIAGACAVLPVSDRHITKAVTNIVKALKYAAILLSFSIIFVLVAFVAAGFVVCSPSSCKSRRYVMGTMGLGVPICILFIVKFVRHLFQVRSQPQGSQSMTVQDIPMPLHPGGARVDQDDVQLAPRLGNRHDYIPWDDGLDFLELKEQND